MLYVIKRDGRTVAFDKMKIVDAVLAAFKDIDSIETDYALVKAGNIADYIADYAEHSDHILGIEEIQDIVEKGLMSTKRKDVARAYISYRNERTKERNANSKLIKDIGKHLRAEDIKNQNANVDEASFGGRKGEATNTLMKQYALDYCVSPKARKNHLENRVYIHDLDSYAVGMHNCLTFPLDKALAEGVKTRQTDIRPANSASTALQLLAVYFQLQSLQQFGGVSVSHLDWSMVPYIRKSFVKHFLDGLKYCEDDGWSGFDKKDIPIESWNKLADDYEKEKNTIKGKNTDSPDWLKTLSIDDDYFKECPRAYRYAINMTEKEISQAVEAMYHNLNTLQSRSGNQLPFTSINYGTCTLPEGRMMTKALLEGSLKGVGKHHKTPIFPCGIFQYMKGVNDKPGTPNYDLYRLALKSTAKRLYPNYANVDWSGNAGYDRNDPKTYFSTMGCRTANGWDINADEGVNPQTKDGRGNICPVTIILPTLAMEAKEKIITLAKISNSEENGYNLIEEFFLILDEAIHDAKDQLIERFDYICSQPADSAKFMYENNIMLGYDGESTRSALRHGTLALGQIGLAETLQILIGENHLTENGMELAKRIEQLFKDRCAEFKEEYRLNFGVYYTPAENLCYTAMKKFKEVYGEMKNISDREYFTNSIHVPVWEEISPFDKIDIESQLTGYSSAGCITYVELDGGMENNLNGLETLVNYAMDHDIPYFAINVPNDSCEDCGYTGEFNEICPECGSSNIRHLRRVTGYLTGDYKTAFNPGKQKETEERFRHSLKMVH